MVERASNPDDWMQSSPDPEDVSQKFTEALERDAPTDDSEIPWSSRAPIIRDSFDGIDPEQHGDHLANRVTDQSKRGFNNEDRPELIASLKDLHNGPYSQAYDPETGAFLGYFAVKESTE